jgi:hypothetical protein
MPANEAGSRSPRAVLCRLGTGDGRIENLTICLPGLNVCGSRVTLEGVSKGAVSHLYDDPPE